MGDAFASVTEMMHSSIKSTVDRSASTAERIAGSVDDSISVIQIATERTQRAAQDISRKLTAYATKNSADLFSHLLKVAQTTDPLQLRKIHMDFLSERMTILQEQYIDLMGLAEDIGDRSTGEMAEKSQGTS